MINSAVICSIHSLNIHSIQQFFTPIQVSETICCTPFLYSSLEYIKVYFIKKPLQNYIRQVIIDIICNYYKIKKKEEESYWLVGSSEEFFKVSSS